jgi:hypothetical protein
MPDKDDKNSGKTSTPGQYERDEKEVSQIDDGHKPNYKSAEDREGSPRRSGQQAGLTFKNLNSRLQGRVFYWL